MKTSVVVPDQRMQFTGPQLRLLNSKAKFPCMVAGYGAGKTGTLVTRLLQLKMAYPKNNVAYYLPTYDLISKIGFPRFEEKLIEMGIKYKLNKTDAEIKIPYRGKIIFRTLDKPERIVGYEVADSGVDELDTMATNKAKDCWNKVVARNRQKKKDGSQNTVAVGTTPEGFKFTYDTWGKNPRPGYELIKASTFSNALNLPDDYIENLYQLYPSNLLEAYLEGEFINLTSGTVYYGFKRELNKSTAIVTSADNVLFVGMDFNVGKMAAVIHVLRGEEEAHAVREFTDVFDTPAMIKTLKEAFPGKKLIIFPDASGDNRKSNNASETDIALLKAAGFTVMVNSRNPAVKDRVLSFNVRLDKNGVRKYFVNTMTCPHLTEALEKQAYDKNGEPDKTAGLDHILDAAGYFVAYRYPIVRKALATGRVIGYNSKRK